MVRGDDPLPAARQGRTAVGPPTSRSAGQAINNKLLTLAVGGIAAFVSKNSQDILEFTLNR
jgi:ribosomal protein L4